MSEQEKKCIKLQEDYRELVRAKEEFDVMLADIKKEKVNSSNIGQISKKVNIAKIRKEEIKDKIKKMKIDVLPEVIRNLIETEKNKLTEFFGEEIKVPNLPKEITKERMEKWQKQGFDLHYLPNMNLSKEKNYPGWKLKPNDFFYEFIDMYDLNKRMDKLEAGWILIDSCSLPKKEDGRLWKYYYENDVLGESINKLVNQKIIEEYKDQRLVDSRFFISWDDLNKNETKIAFADVLKVKPDNIGLPKAIEWNFLGNAFYPVWGKVEASEWFSDCYIDHYFGNKEVLSGGYSGLGGLSYVRGGSRGSRETSLSFRLLIRFPEDKK